MKLVVSSYERMPNNSLSLIDVDIENKTYKHLDDIALFEPSFVISFKKDNKDYVITYSKNDIKLLLYLVKNNKLEMCDEYYLPYPFTSLTHLLYLDKLERLYACCYKDKAYLRIDIKEEKFSNLKFNQNRGRSACHQMIYLEKSDEIGVVDIFKDCVDLFDLDLNYKRSLKIDKGAGPRHGIVMDDFLYLVTEYSNELYKISSLSGKIVSKASTLKEKCISYGGTLFSIGDTIYASNRGEDDIAIFEDKDTLNKIDNVSYFGKNSRHMIKTKDEKYIISCNMDSSYLSIIDVKDKKLVMNIAYSKVACVTEL